MTSLGRPLVISVFVAKVLFGIVCLSLSAVFYWKGQRISEVIEPPVGRAFFTVSLTLVSLLTNIFGYLGVRQKNNCYLLTVSDTDED